ncbi:unnamed protein product [Nesidiocoris tenuis]|nr:unnamed protein product [Nesidiocoris tenuis]
MRFAEFQVRICGAEHLLSLSAFLQTIRSLTFYRRSRPRDQIRTEICPIFAWSSRSAVDAEPIVTKSANESRPRLMSEDIISPVPSVGAYCEST